MQLAKHVAQGKLTYLSQDKEAISVNENEHYRWLAFGCSNEHSEQVIQSVMLKRKPWKLTLPHQTAMMLPLLFFKPKSMIELGLGGGNIQRFIHHISNNINLQSIEHSSTVIDCFNQYFNPQNNQANLVYNDSKKWLQENTRDYDWYVCDVYQQEIQSYNNTVDQLEHLTANITPNTCLSINLPDATDYEVNLLLTLLKELSSDHEIVYFHIPNYLNIVIHLIPKQWHIYKRIKRNKYSYLPKNIFSRWKQFWQHGKKLPD
ncbi:hypothetical protein Q4503_06535 [Colwellia sp. 6_MG-2023]|uniref:hypothetical protein n=1 Tax=Colwellia sp. 6_MG-2023 TaxID=3062676 RepID=UPI0026E21C86|nr:hypothetical protein [Colwellia sp. 6_MG-2023]MDO6487351.1 hypothetical protein [Colwellia sp. 6_MG-2023]